MQDDGYMSQLITQLGLSTNEVLWSVSVAIV